MNPKPTITNATIGGRIRAARVMRRLKQSDVCSYTGGSKSHLSDIENGKRGISAANLYTLAQCLQVSPGSLLRDESHHHGECKRCGGKVWFVAPGGYEVCGEGHRVLRARTKTKPSKGE